MCDNRFMKDPMPADEMPGQDGSTKPAAKDTNLGELSGQGQRGDSRGYG